MRRTQLGENLLSASAEVVSRNGAGNADDDVSLADALGLLLCFFRDFDGCHSAAGLLLILGYKGQRQYAIQRNANPRRTIVELVDQLVERLVEDVDVEERVEFLPIGGNDEGIGDRLAISAQKFGGDGGFPEARPGFQLRKFFRTAGGVFGERDQSGVAEGAQHAGHVFERRMLGAAFGERARGLALEVEDDEVAFGAQDLAEMIVAVDARPLRRRCAAPEARGIGEQKRRDD